ncbi:cathelicidin-related peptide Oh-Cath-like [Hyla sarda]|uniref:cathelicidin-related peptide Oh-Cath-like n=1 Tax=Hyla sarda TaxID=327740 RepID=UPI0024C42B20|nr:cathelicidin-related peptide Oh-Cath-like [Hyla sarda]
MLRWRLSLLIFSAVILYGCLSTEPGVQNEESIREIVDLYNQRKGVTYLYKALDQIPTALLEEDGNPNRRNFIIGETVCLKSKTSDLSQCDFKPDGDAKICAVDLGNEDPENIICTILTKDVMKRFSRRRSQGRRCPRPGEGTALLKPCKRDFSVI